VSKDWTGTKVTVLGLGRSGFSAARYLHGKGAQVFVSDGGKEDAKKKEQIASLKALGVKVETGAHSKKALEFGELIVISPGISPESDVVKQATELGKEIICDIELAYRESTVPIVAVTGTNGKSTTCALISHILSRAGHKAPACGNFGVPILDALADKPDYLVAEVSSFQLHYCDSFAPFVAVWLNLTPDHLEWHGSLEKYIEDKKKIFAKQKPSHYAVMNQDDYVVSGILPEATIFPFSVYRDLDQCIQASYMKGDQLVCRIYGGTDFVCGKADLKIIGDHNLENALAAMSACAALGIDIEMVGGGLKSFEALEHRLEYVATIDGVRFFNDSKATNPASTIKALEAFEGEKVVLILGGRDKGTALAELVISIKANASQVILIGEATERFAAALSEDGYTEVKKAGSLSEAVDLGATLKKGPVLLSPACASFDMFKDYEDRGRVFKDLVHTRLEKMAPSH
jgi:UDP-N-acetylmuramoylalanine--D-glutamate ligase